MVRSERFPLFESLRAIAALCVVAYHVALIYPVPMSSPVYDYTRVLGRTGVTVFFLISGFLLFRPFVRANVDATEPPGAVPYAWRRFLRIAPAYWVALTAVVLMGKGGAMVREDPLVYYGLLQAYSQETFLGGIGQAWTLTIEVAFYAFLPVWAMLIAAPPLSSPSRRLCAQALGVVGLFVASVTYQLMLLPSGYPLGADDYGVAYALPRYLNQFALGMGLAVVSVWRARTKRLPPPRRLLDALPGLSWGAALVLFWLVATQSLTILERDLLSGGLALALLAPAVFGDPTRGLVRRFLSTRVMLFLGLVSYGIYLYHLAFITRVADAVGGEGAPRLVAIVVIGVGGSVALGALSFRFVEQPARRLGRLIPDPRQREAVRGAPASRDVRES